MQIKRYGITPVILFIFTIFLDSLGSCAESVSGAVPPVIAVQTRSYLLHDEITAQLGYMPLDSFNRYVAVGGTYTHFFNNYEAWEILNLNKANGFTSGLTKDLQNMFNVSTEPFDTLDYYFTSNFIYTPFFTKNLINGTSIIMGDVSFVGGFGMAKFDSGYINCADVGVIFRYFLSHVSSLKFDFRQMVYFSSAQQNNLLLFAGVAFNFGTQEAAKVDVPVKDPDE